MKPALLTTIAVTVDILVRREGMVPGASWGAHGSSTKGGPSNAASAADTAPSHPPARGVVPGGSALSASFSSAAATASAAVVPVVRAMDVEESLAGDATSPAGVAFVRGSIMAPSRSGMAGGAASGAALAISPVGVADVDEMHVVDDERTYEVPVVKSRGVAQ